MDLTAVKLKARRAEDIMQRVLASAGLRHSESKIIADAQAYWSDPGESRWESNSHWRNGSLVDKNDIWPEIGRRHVELFERGTRAVNFRRSWGRVLEWGCGGGANAVHFAPRADEFIGIDISTETLAECGRQIRMVSDTTWRPIRIDVDSPEGALDHAQQCDVWLSFYVFELIPSPEYGERLLRIAHRMLTPGGLAFIQVKYNDGRWARRARRRSYRSGLASMTTYRIDEFWTLAQKCGFTPETIELVPKNELDERYAYFLLTRP